MSSPITFIEGLSEADVHSAAWAAQKHLFFLYGLGGGDVLRGQHRLSNTEESARLRARA